MNGTDQSDWRRMLTAAERAVMLDDIACVSLAAGANLFPERPWSELPISAGSAAAVKSPLEQLGFIEYLLPVLTQALPQIAHSPLTSAAVATQAALPQHARRVAASAWMAYTRRGQAARSIEETVTLLSPDTPENRAVNSFLRVLERDSRAIGQIAEAEEEAKASVRAARCARRLHQMRSEIWWEEVSSRSGDWTQPPTHREILRPDYACIARERSRYRKQFCFDWNQPLLTLPPRETWRLYEIWCFLTVLNALRGQGWELSKPQELFVARQGRLTVTLATGERSRVVLRSPGGQSVSLTYNQAFAEGRESLSHTMQPDITLSDGKRLWILDAKFKPYTEPGEEGGDINQMHAYRDAIVDSRGTRNVIAAWCLYAGQAGALNRARITYGRREDTAVGALCLRPGNTASISDLGKLLAGWPQTDLSKPAPPLFPET